MLKKWEELPEFMRNKEVYQYYKLLETKRFQLVIKRVFDIIVSLLMIIVVSPILIVISLLIKLDSRGSIFYRQERITQYGRSFRIFKFRTMVSNADKIGTLITIQNDNRITNIGNKIRKCRIDELPQLFNILIGDMSFIGTRPEVKKFVDVYTNEMKATLLLPAGVTSLASIEFKNEDEIINEYVNKGYSVDEAYVNEVLPKKMVINLLYLRECRFFKDIIICYETFKSIF
ncbi:MAG: sugar transferase [Bacilli bacterium]